MSELFVPDPHQVRMMRFLRKTPDAGLFVGMGLGKTSAVLHANNESCLIVAPKRVATLVWPSEIRKWGLDDWFSPHYDLRTQAGYESLNNDRRGIYIINWDRLPELVSRYLSRVPRARWPFDRIIFDELTKAKSHQSKRVNAFRPFSDQVSSRWGLTGTPRPNSATDLFAQLRLIDKGERLGVSYDHFEKTYFYHPDIYQPYFLEAFPGSEEKIAEKISDICLTITREEVLGKPEIDVEDIEVALPPEAIKPYKKLERELMASFFPGQKVLAANAAVCAGKLVQISAGAVYDGDPNDPKDRHWTEIHTAKIKALVKYMRAVKEPVLIAYHYKHEKVRLKSAFPDIVFFDEGDERKIVDRWNARKISVLAVHPKSAAHGLNMQFGGRTIIWLSLHWSREEYDQLNGRLDRRGQTKRVRLVRILCTNTIDEAIAQTLESRGEKQATLLQTISYYHELTKKDA